MEDGKHLVGDDMSNWPTVGQVGQRVLSVVNSTDRYLQQREPRRVDLSPVLVRERLGKVIESLNGLVPYPRLTDKVKDLNVGVNRFLDEHVKRPIHSAFLLDVVNVMSTNLSWGLDAVLE